MTSSGYSDGAEIRVVPIDPGPVPPTGSASGSGPAEQVASAAQEHAGQVAGSAKEQASQVAGAVTEQAGNVAGTAKEQAGELAGTAQEQVAQVAGQASDQARELLGQARSQVSGQVATQKGQLTDRLHQLAGELSGLASGKASPEGSGAVAGLAQQASERVSRLAEYVETREPQQLLDEGRRFASSRPGTFLAGAALLGALAGRVTKGSKAASSSGEPSGTGTTAPPPVPVVPVAQPVAAHAPLVDPVPLLSETPVIVVDAPAFEAPLPPPASPGLPPLPGRPSVERPYGG